MKGKLFQVPAIRLLAVLAVIAVVLSPLALPLLQSRLPTFFEGKLEIVRWLECKGHDVFVLKIPAEHEGWAATQEEMIELWDSLIEMSGEGWIYMFVALETEEGLQMEYIATLNQDYYPEQYVAGVPATEEGADAKLELWYGASRGGVINAVANFEYEYSLYAGYYGIFLPTPEWIVNIPKFKQGDDDIVAWAMDWVYWLAYYSEQPWAEELYFSTLEGG